MTALSVNQRQAVVLKYVEGRTLKEISDELSLPLGTVKTRIRDGLARLRETSNPTTAARPEQATEPSRSRYRSRTSPARIQTRMAPSSRLPQAK